ncbi:hypothetical protein [Nitrosospira sp. NRS527]|uniref:hypothetical protein n=1 Tax=Nitrosospira sp. NRS527 TaxID=155925 RepID=UPI001BCCACEE|nr:hypothetical protein [Nitrosospira sp. NRS527]
MQPPELNVSCDPDPTLFNNSREFGFAAKKSEGRIMELKTMVVELEVSMIGITNPGGSNEGTSATSG